MDENALDLKENEKNKATSRGFFAEFSERLRPGTSIPLTGIFVLLIFYTIYFAAPVLVPITVALLLSVLLSPFVDRLERLRVPRVAGAAVVIIITFGVISAGLITVASPAQEWLTKLPESFKKALILRAVKPFNDFVIFESGTFGVIRMWT